MYKYYSGPAPFRIRFDCPFEQELIRFTKTIWWLTVRILKQSRNHPRAKHIDWCGNNSLADQKFYFFNHVNSKWLVTFIFEITLKTILIIFFYFQRIKNFLLNFLEIIFPNAIKSHKIKTKKNFPSKTTIIHWLVLKQKKPRLD